MSTLDAPPVLHPLEPLSAQEVSAAAAILKAGKGLAATARFVFISLHEPPKAAVQAGEPVPREAFVVLYEKAERKTYEAVVSLTEEAGASFTHIEGVQPPVTFEEFMACEAVVQADPGWQAAMRKASSSSRPGSSPATRRSTCRGHTRRTAITANRTRPLPPPTRSPGRPRKSTRGRSGASWRSRAAGPARRA
jgi:hypothetical protein